MFAILQALASFFGDFFKSSRQLETENLILRHQLNIALRRPLVGFVSEIAFF